MFKRLAKSRLADFTFGGFRHLQPPNIALRGVGFSNDACFNDNLPGLRRPKGQRRIPTPALACHWFDRNGRLECRWNVEDLDGMSVEEPDGRRPPGETCGWPLTFPHRPFLAAAS